MPPAIPIATYRLQLSPQFGFDEAAAIVPYLKSLGISHLYASPFLKARSGTTHGYDIVDHGELNPEFGGNDAFSRLSTALRDADMGLILDFVPNHMAVHRDDNARWLDVLEWGPRSRYAKFFDIDWDTQTGQPRVLLPILGRSYGEVLESGEIELRYDAAEGSFSAWYFEHRLPIGPYRYGEILQKVVATAEASDTPPGRQLLDLAARYRGPRNPPPEAAPGFKRDIAAVAGGREVIERGLSAYQAGPDEPAAVIALHYLLERQHYRPAYWRLALSDINYRRFFDINELAGLKVEEPEVFKAIHGLVFRLIEEGRLHGLRLDHIDGLRDPHQYLRRLQRELQSRGQRSFYVVVEKILEGEEPLPKFPGVAGTTGYEWLNTISQLLLDDRGLVALDQIWRELPGAPSDFGALLRRSKRRVLETILASEFTVLARLLARIAAGHYSTRDYAPQRLQDALELYVLNFPIYRSYVTSAGPTESDRAVIRTAIDASRDQWFGPDAGIFDFLTDALTMDLVARQGSRHSATRVRLFALKMQQLTGPMMAKSLEDTAFYRYHRVLALNEVGGDPQASGLSTVAFHERMAARAKRAPHGMTATATHDTKRGEDARARLLVLSELADEWATQVRQWRELNAPLVTGLPTPRPTPAHEYMLYQALLGAWPLEGIDKAFVERMQAYAIKAAREGKERTSWIAPDERYEAGLTAMVAALLDRGRSPDFLDGFDAFAKRVALIGALNGLTQVALKLTIPGVPDLYQGTEFWDLSLVDPDNRRPVDFRAREAALRSLQPQPDWAALAQSWTDGRLKLALTHTLLALRRQWPQLFAGGDYRPLEVRGPDRDEIVAFARTHGDDALVLVIGRRFGRATDAGCAWPQGKTWEASISLVGFRSMRGLLPTSDAIAGPEAPVADLFGAIPVAVLHAKIAERVGRDSDDRGRNPGTQRRVPDPSRAATR
jgi:(1->4)-alpha-D-glucan 1-alpha-D-glucosylmutase